MGKTQEEKFDLWVGMPVSNSDWIVACKTWEACFEANGIGEGPRIPEGYFKIGEKIRFRKKGREEWSNGTVYIHAQFASESYWGDDIEAVRIPAWKPKDGEAVFWYNGSVVHVGRIDAVHGNEYDVTTYLDTYVAKLEFLKPFDASKIGKPWSEI